MADSTIVRTNVDTLLDPELGVLRDAYAKMMALSDNRGFNYYAGLHGVPNWYCWHAPRLLHGVKANLFLPWHRAYLLAFEHAMRDQNADATLPWWDWTSSLSHTSGIPAAFASATVGGQNNSLFTSHISVPDAQPPLNRDTTRNPGLPSELPLASAVAGLILLPDFEDFSDQLQDVHNAVHDWTGGGSGDMSSLATAAFDPIFWSHHCMIDRLWYLWQLKNGMNTIPAKYLNLVLSPFTQTVQEVLDIGGLGYAYAQSNVVVPAAGA